MVIAGKGSSELEMGEVESDLDIGWLYIRTTVLPTIKQPKQITPKRDSDQKMMFCMSGAMLM